MVTLRYNMILANHGILGYPIFRDWWDSGFQRYIWKWSETLKPLDVWIFLNGTPRLQATSSAKETLSDSVKDLLKLQTPMELTGLSLLFLPEVDHVFSKLDQGETYRSCIYFSWINQSFFFCLHQTFLMETCQRLGRSYATCISARSISVAWQNVKFRPFWISLDVETWPWRSVSFQEQIRILTSVQNQDYSADGHFQLSYVSQVTPRSRRPSLCGSEAATSHRVLRGEFLMTEKAKAT